MKTQLVCRLFRFENRGWGLSRSFRGLLRCSGILLHATGASVMSNTRTARFEAEIRDLAAARQYDKVMETVDYVRAHNIPPSLGMINTVLRSLKHMRGMKPYDSLATRQSLSQMSDVIGWMKDEGVAPDIVTMEHLASVYCKEATFDPCLFLQQLRDYDLSPSVKLVTVLLSAAATTGDKEAFASILSEAMADGVPQTPAMKRDHYRLLREEGNTEELARIAESLEQAVARAPTLDDHLCLFYVYCEAGSVEKADSSLTTVLSLLEPSASALRTDLLDMQLRLYLRCGCDREIATLMRKRAALQHPLSPAMQTDLANYFWSRGTDADFAAVLESVASCGPLKETMYSTLLHRASRGKATVGVKEAFMAAEMFGIRPRSIHTHKVMKYFVECDDKEGLQWILDAAEKLRIELVSQDYLTLLNFHSKHGDTAAMEGLVTALENSSVELDTKHINCLINRYANVGDVDGIDRCLKKLEEHDLAPNSVTYNVLIKFHVQQRNKDGFEEVYRRRLEAGLPPCGYCYGHMLEGYVGVEDQENAERMLMEMLSLAPKFSAEELTCAFNTMCKLYIITKQPNRVIALLTDMEQASVRPDEFTQSLIIAYYVQNPARDRSLEDVVDRMLTLCTPDVKLYNRLLDYYCRGKDSQRAYSMLKTMKDRKVPIMESSLQVLLKLCYAAGDDTGVARVLKLMEMSGIEPKRVKAETKKIRFDDVNPVKTESKALLS